MGGVKESNSVASPFGLRSGLRQSGRRLRRWLFIGTAESVPYRVVVGRRRWGAVALCAVADSCRERSE
jgi:hypothetical protein